MVSILKKKSKRRGQESRTILYESNVWLFSKSKPTRRNTALIQLQKGIFVCKTCAAAMATVGRTSSATFFMNYFRNMPFHHSPDVAVEHWLACHNHTIGRRNNHGK
jgi:hypothetical protein